jgi:hypothetical protein
VDEGPDAGGDRLLQQDERARDVRVHERLPRVGRHVRLVQRGRVDHGVGPAHRRADPGAVGHRGRDVGVRRVEEVEADDVVAGTAQGADQRLTQVPRTAGHEDPHAVLTPLLSSEAQPR